MTATLGPKPSGARDASGSGRVNTEGGPVCSVEGCDRPRKSRGWCNTHYERWRTNGDVQADDPVRPHALVPVACALDGCERAAAARGLCQSHYDLLRRHGSPTAPKRGDFVGYVAAHTRVWNQRGKASGHLCMDCGERAAHWSLRRDAVGTLVDARGYRYSMRTDDYEPRCVRCHSIYDREVAA